MDLTGACCGLFEVWGPISEGGMSRVWLARHRELSVPVVIKTLLAQGETDAFARLRNEARMMARIPSSRVVHAVDVGVHEGDAYLVQEYVDGLDLAELDARRRKALGRSLPLWFVCSALHEVAEALQSAHQTGVLHRDVKPSNLFGSPQIGIRLGDFGIAVARDNQGERSSGTLRFIAPEALRGEQPTRRCDVYSLGATGYDLLYGRPPRTELHDILGGGPTKFPAARSPEEAYFQHVLARMLEPEPDARFSSIVKPMKLFGALSRSLSPPTTATELARGVYQIGSTRVVCKQGDIAAEEVDAIVNSAVDDMRMDRGVGACLRARGGKIIEDEALAGGRRALGECVATTGGSLACKKVLHAVAAWREASCIARTSQRALLVAEELGMRTLAIPALGTGVAKVSAESCAYAVASALLEHVLLGGSKLREVRFVLYDKTTYDVFVDELDGVFLDGADFEDDASSPSAALRDLATDETMHVQLTSISRDLDLKTTR